MTSSWQILEKWLEFNMSHPVNTEILENLFEEVQADFPELTEDEQINLTNRLFEDLCQ